MKLLNKLQSGVKNWLFVFPKLIWEVILFLLNIPYFCYLFFHGFRITVDSYSKLLDGLSSNKQTIKELFKSKLDEKKTTELSIKLWNETIRLRNEQEKSFTVLFGIFIAILSLFISLIALLLKK